MQRVLLRPGFLLAVALCVVGCDVGSTSATGGSGGSSASSGQGQGGSGGEMDGGAVPVGPSMLPVPPGPSNVPAPSGNAANLKVLPWAGFKSAVTYTFDDAQPSQVEHYAELQAAGVPMTFYVNSSNQWIPSYDATWTQAVKDGHEIGNHTANHCHADLTGCGAGSSPVSQEQEIDECTSYITQHFNQKEVWTMASPFGDNGWNEPAKTRFFMNRGVASGMVGPSDSTDPFNLPIHLAVTDETAESFNGYIDMARGSGQWVILLIHTISPTDASWFNPVAITAITESMSHARSLADVWADTLVSVGAYWLGQKTLEGAVPSDSGGSKTWTWTLPAHFPKGKYLRVKVDGGTLKQGNAALAWDGHGYYEVSLDAGSLTWSP